MRDKHDQNISPSASPPKSGERRYSTPRGRCEKLLVALKEHHDRIVPGGSFEDFTKLAWGGFNGRVNDRLRGDEFILALVNVQPHKEGESSPLPRDPTARARWIALFAATAYCYEAINAFREFDMSDPPNEHDEVAECISDLNDAWDYAFDAAQWEGLLCGFLNGSKDTAEMMISRIIEGSKRGIRNSVESRRAEAERFRLEVVRAAKQLGWPDVTTGINKRLAIDFERTEERIRQILKENFPSEGGSLGK